MEDSEYNDSSNPVYPNGLAYTPQTKWEYAPFFKRHVFTGASQADQAANLVTSPSFQSFWSKGGNQTDYTSLFQIDSEAERVRHQIRLNSVGGISGSNFDIDRQAPRIKRPSIPVPPQGIRNIQFASNGWPVRIDNSILGMDYDQVLKEGAFVPVEQRDIFPSLTPQEREWWTKNLEQYQKDLLRADKASSNFRSIPVELRNQSGALIRADRDKLRLLNYGLTDQPLTRMVNASDSRNLLNVSAEFERGMSSAYGGPRVKYPNVLRFLSTQNPDASLAVLEGRRLQQIREEMRLFEEARRYPYLISSSKDSNLNILAGKTPTPFLDVVTPVPEPVAVPNALAGESRRVGRMTRDFVTGVTKNGNTWNDPLPSTTTTIYGPPSKYAGLQTALNNGVSVSLKALAVLGGIMEVQKVPDRIRGYYINALKQDPNWRPDVTDKIGMSLFAGLESALNYGSMGLWDEKERIARDATSTAGYGKGYYGTMIPEKGTTSVHYNPESRYDKKQGFEITDTINDEITHFINK
jgi:hypothetical protein